MHPKEKKSIESSGDILPFHVFSNYTIQYGVFTPINGYFDILQGLCKKTLCYFVHIETNGLTSDSI